MANPIGIFVGGTSQFSASIQVGISNATPVEVVEKKQQDVNRVSSVKISTTKLITPVTFSTSPGSVLQGAAGVKGATGAQGAEGVAGSPGTNGLNGATGAQGTTGATGANGTSGTNGATGATGSNGTNGATGSTGATGSQGVQGATGATGSQGVQGATGAIPTNYVISFNGTTGAVTGITAGGANVFTALNSFSGGISAGGNVVFNAVTAVFGASAANTTPITVYKDNSADNPAVDDGFGNTTFDTPNNKVPLTLSFTEVYDPNTGLTASTPGSTMIRVRDQTAGLDTFTVTDLGNIVCGTIVCSSITPTAFSGNLDIGAGNFIQLNWDGTLPAPTVLSVYNSNTSTNALTLKGDGTFSHLSTSGTVSGATGAFSKLLTASGGLSASGATFSGNISAPNIVDLKRGWFL